MPIALVITAPGINCDQELADAFTLSGCDVESIHVKRLIAEPDLVARFDLIGLPGGFSYGDDVAAGRIMATLIRRHLYGALTSAIGRGVPMIAPCNGFQIAVQAGLLPGPASGSWPESPAAPEVSLTDNASARFDDRWVGVEIPAGTRCIWTRGLDGAADDMLLPVAHGEGRFVAAPDRLATLEAAGQIAIRYRGDANPNGSMGDVAGLCDASGLVFGLMPHPERWVRPTQHPFWTRRSDVDGEPLGLRMFRQAVLHAAGTMV